MRNTSTYLPPGAGEAVWIGSFGTMYKVPSEATGGAVAIVEHVLGPHQLGAPLHRHSREDEISYVLEGKLTVQQGEKVETAAVGGTIVKPRGVFHAFWNAGRPRSASSRLSRRALLPSTSASSPRCLRVRAHRTSLRSAPWRPGMGWSSTSAAYLSWSRGTGCG